MIKHVLKHTILWQHVHKYSKPSLLNVSRRRLRIFEAKLKCLYNFKTTVYCWNVILLQNKHSCKFCTYLTTKRSVSFSIQLIALFSTGVTVPWLDTSAPCSINQKLTSAKTLEQTQNTIFQQVCTITTRNDDMSRVLNLNFHNMYLLTRFWQFWLIVYLIRIFSKRLKFGDRLK